MEGITIDYMNADTQERCQGPDCPVLTTGRATVKREGEDSVVVIVLCPDHQQGEHVASLLHGGTRPSAGTSTSEG